MCPSVLTVHACNEFNNLIKTQSNNWTHSVAVRTKEWGGGTKACLFLSLTFAQNKLHALPQPDAPGICNLGSAEGHSSSLAVAHACAHEV